MLGSWSLRPAGPGMGDPVVAVRPVPSGFRITAPEARRGYVRRSVAGAACSLSIDLVRAFADSAPGDPCLHAAAAAVHGRLVVLIGPPRAGKSTLLAQLACEGWPVFADDALTLAGDGLGRALGIAPRLRRPLPRGTDERLRAFVSAHRGPSDRRNLYLDLPAPLLAPFGATAPLGSVLVLDRRPGEEPSLARVPPGAALRALVGRVLPGRARAADTLERLHDLAARIPCFSLAYGDTAEAAELVVGRAADLSGPVRGEAQEPRGLAAPLVPAASRDEREACADPEAWLRGGGLLALDLGTDLFLVDPERNAIHHLNPVAAGIWHLLEEPLRAADLLAVLGGAFPAVDGARLGADLDAILDRLRRLGLVHRGHPRGDPGGAARNPRPPS